MMNDARIFSLAINKPTLSVLSKKSILPPSQKNKKMQTATTPQPVCDVISYNALTNKDFQDMTTSFQKIAQASNIPLQFSAQNSGSGNVYCVARTGSTARPYCATPEQWKSQISNVANLMNAVVLPTDHVAGMSVGNLVPLNPHVVCASNSAGNRMCFPVSAPFAADTMCSDLHNFMQRKQ